jgi:hypothetical protein
MEQSKIQDGLCAEEVEDSLVEPNRPQHHPGDRRTRRGPLFLKWLTFFALLCLMWWQVIPQNKKVQRAGQLPPKDTAGKLVDYDHVCRRFQFLKIVPDCCSDHSQSEVGMAPLLCTRAGFSVRQTHCPHGLSPPIERER